MSSKAPRVFIGSSVEGLEVAENIQLGLDYHAECTIWSQGVFGLSMGTLESLVAAAKSFDFAILVLTPDDLVYKRETPRNSPRDNVLFELGIFMGALGRERTYIVYCRNEKIDLPTDLAGVTAATYAKRADGNLRAAVGAVCTQFRAAMKDVKLGFSPSVSGELKDVGELSEQVVALKKDLAEQTGNLRRMIEAIASSRTSSSIALEASARGSNQLGELDFLQGAWRNTESNSLGYGRLVDGELVFAYCFGGGNELTGEYRELRVVGGALVGRFLWVDQSVSGYVYLKIIGGECLKGGWWYAEDVPEQIVERLPDVKGMVPSIWVRIEPTPVFPKWAEDYFARIQDRPKPKRR